MKDVQLREWSIIDGQRLDQLFRTHGAVRGRQVLECFAGQLASQMTMLSQALHEKSREDVVAMSQRIIATSWTTGIALACEVAATIQRVAGKGDLVNAEQVASFLALTVRQGHAEIDMWLRKHNLAPLTR